MKTQELVRFGITVVRLFGEFDAASAPTVQERLKVLTSGERPIVVLDFTGVPFMSSAGLRVLQMSLRSAQSSHGAIRLASVSAPVLAVLQQTGMATLFTIYPDADTALQDFDMEAAAKVVAEVRIVELTGELDANNAPELEQRLRDLINNGVSRLVLDMGHVTFVTSAALRVFQVLLMAARAHGGDVRLATVQPQVQQILNALGFNTLLKSFDTVQGAVESYD